MNKYTLFYLFNGVLFYLVLGRKWRSEHILGHIYAETQKILQGSKTFKRHCTLCCYGDWYEQHGNEIFIILQYAAQRGKFPASFFSRNKPVAQTKTYMNAREVMALVMLEPGEYLIVPSTFNPNETASFILTILSKAETHVQ